MTRVTVVAANQVVPSGTVDFTFLNHAGPETYGDPWGLLELVDGKGSVNRFRAMQEGD